MLCEPKSLFEESIVRRVAAHDAIQGDCVRRSQVAGDVHKITMYELCRLRPPTPGCFL